MGEFYPPPKEELEELSIYTYGTIHLIIHVGTHTLYFQVVCTSVQTLSVFKFMGTVCCL